MVAVPVARDIMKTTIRVVHPDMSVLAAMHALHNKGENAAMVVDDDFRLVGILTEKDCLRILLHEMYDRFEEIGRALVADFMSPVVETLTPGMDLFAVASAFLRTNFTALPVVDEGVHVTRFLGRDVVLDPEALDLTREAHRQVRCVEMGDMVDAGLSGDDAGPGLVHGVAHRGDEAQTGHDNAATGHADAECGRLGMVRVRLRPGWPWRSRSQPGRW